MIDNGRVVGILTAADLDAVPREAWPYHRVADHMTDRDHVPTLAADDVLDTAVAALTSSHLQRAFILDGRAPGGAALDRRRGPRPRGRAPLLAGRAHRVSR